MEVILMEGSLISVVFKVRFSRNEINEQFEISINHVRIFTIRTLGVFAELKDFKSIQSIHVDSCSSQILT